MFKFKLASKNEKQEYQVEVQKYFKRNGLAITYSIYNESLDMIGLSESDVSKILPTPFPIASWINENDKLKQFLCMMKCVGYENAYIKDKRIFFDMLAYKKDVQIYLKIKSEFILDKLSYYCGKNPRINYEDIQEILGYSYPKIVHSKSVDNAVCAIVFLKQIGIVFRFDTNAIYMP